jgi:hypothetical protein
MADAAALYDALQAISERVDDDMSERDVENLFIEQKFYDALDYEGTGIDIRSEFTLPDDRRPDYITLDTNEAVTAVYEYKTTGRSLPPHENQLFHYMDHLRAEYGVLTNGEELRLYRRGETRATLTVSISEVTESQVRDLTSALQKREFDLTSPDHVNRFLSELDPIPLDKQAELGQEHFFDTFRLEEDSPFADLVTGMMDLLEELRDKREAKFVKGAYDFWEATYASEPDEVPSSWEPFLNGNQSLRDFMFCLESGHALLARLLLAKATEDHDFFAGTGYDGMDDYFRGLQGFGQSINLDAFPVAADNLIDDMQEQLVEGLFQDDIFVWWTDGYEEQLSRGHETGANQFQAVAEGTGSVERISEVTRNRFSRAVAEVFFNVLRFDFGDVEGDLLGDLYQRYFDPETRKALGEFYTPQPVIDYIMDGVGYERGVSSERLIDPACGSGTFLVEAVERYLADVERYEDDPDWKEHLQDLCTRPRVVGLDIHPFAVLMAQIRFVVAILPAYRQAKQSHPDYTIRRLPIYRTDTLRNERELTGADLGDDGTRQMTFDAMAEDEQDVRIPVPLPVEINEDEAAETEDGFLVRRVRMPLFDTIQLETGVGNFGEYFAALQGVLDTVKDHMTLAEEFGGDFDWTYQSGLEERINHHTEREYSGVEEFFAPYVDDMLENVRYLKEEHNDGRLFKMFEDTVLALVVKNYMDYDYVVGNPPYVSSQNIPERKKEMLGELYPDSTTDQYDLYCPFFDRGLEWLGDGDRLGFITPNQFMVANYGSGVREIIQENTIVEQIQDFRDSGVFKDATNYPVITILQMETEQEVRDDNVIRCGRVKSNVNEESGRELDEQIVDTLKNECRNAGYSDEFVDIFEFPQSRLSESRWPVMPEHEWEVFVKIQSEAEYLVDDVTEAVFQGIMTGKKGVYIVEVLDADLVAAEDSGSVVTISPTGGEGEYEIETDVLRPFIDGKEVERWQVTWGGYHIVHPYEMVETEDGDEVAKLIDEETLSADLPLTMDYFESYREELISRSSLGDKHWYEYSRPQNLEKFERPKLILSKIAHEATYMSDTEGTWYFTTPYSVLLDDERGNIAQEMTAQLNSKVLDFYFKHISAVKAGGFYEYLNQYITPVPCKVEAPNGEFSQMRDSVEQILSAIHMENKTERFPEAYLGNYSGELDYITYEWQTRRYPVNAEVQGDVEGDFTVQAGRSDTINDPAMYSHNREARKRRAEYVHAAVDGRNVKSGEEMTIPIPRSDEDVDDLLTRLEADRNDVRKANIGELEAEIDEAVYNLFGLTKEEREIVEEYLKTF